MDSGWLIAVSSGIAALIGSAVGPVLSRRWTMGDREREMRREYATQLLQAFRSFVVMESQDLREWNPYEDDMVPEPPIQLELGIPAPTHAIIEFVRTSAFTGQARSGHYLALRKSANTTDDLWKIHEAWSKTEQVIAKWSKRSWLWPAWRLRLRTSHVRKRGIKRAADFRAATEAMVDRHA